MEKESYEKAYKEVLEILKYMPKQEINKIPQNMIYIFYKRQDREHKFEIDKSKSLQEQKIMSETKAILANIYRDYLATPNKRKAIIEKENYEIALEEEEKRKKYSVENIFKK